MTTTVEQAKETIETISFEDVRDVVMNHLSKFTAPSDKDLIVTALQLVFEQGRHLGYAECIVTLERLLEPKKG